MHLYAGGNCSGLQESANPAMLQVVPAGDIDAKELQHSPSTHRPPGRGP